MRTAVVTLVRAGTVLILVLACATVGFAQFSGNVQGVVSDPTGAAINGATVTLRNSDTAVTLTTTTSESGNYRFSSLPPGPYVVKSEASGFRTTEVNLTLGTAQTQGINLTLPISTASETISVTSEAPPIDIDDTRLETTLSASTVRDLPSANRNLWDVLAVTPGVVG